MPPSEPQGGNLSSRRGRSYERIDDATLDRLAGIARADRTQFLEGRPEYRGRLLCVALCQGAGLHYVDVKWGSRRPNGIKDFDVWSFFARIPGQRFPGDRRHTNRDFGSSRFGRMPADAKHSHFDGRRVDLLMRDLDASVGADPVEALRAWLREGRTGSQRALAAKGVVLLQPRGLRGRIVWPPRT
jgi:hypothetical protein